MSHAMLQRHGVRLVMFVAESPHQPGQRFRGWVHARFHDGVGRQNPIRFLRTDFQNNFESWQMGVFSHFSSDIGKDHSGRAQTKDGSNIALGAIFVPAAPIAPIAPIAPMAGTAAYWRGGRDGFVWTTCSPPFKHNPLPPVEQAGERSCDTGG